MQQTQWEFLKKSASTGRVPHALLFFGSCPDKKATALEFIKLVNREEIKEGHPDLYVIEPGEEEEIKISRIRDLRSKLSLRAYSASFKSVIIDQAHTLNREAQSAFLKLLEEPKGNTVFILITEYPEQLLPTVLSRVERIRFCSPLPFCQKEKEEELLKIIQADLGQRFQYAKKLAENPKLLLETLENWLRYFRSALISDPEQIKIVDKIKKIQNTHYLISTTNTNPKLALEVLMLEL